MTSGALALASVWHASQSQLAVKVRARRVPRRDVNQCCQQPGLADFVVCSRYDYDMVSIWFAVCSRNLTFQFFIQNVIRFHTVTQFLRSHPAVFTPFSQIFYSSLFTLANRYMFNRYKTYSRERLAVISKPYHNHITSISQSLQARQDCEQSLYNYLVYIVFRIRVITRKIYVCRSRPCSRCICQ